LRACSWSPYRSRSTPSSLCSPASSTYLGVAVGECLGYLFTGTWTVLVGVAMLQSSLFAPWLAVPGIAIGSALIAGSLEFVGRYEATGWKLAAAIVPIAYIAWSIWLLSAGVVLVLR
jgi:hypothetical protein